MPILLYKMSMDQDGCNSATVSKTIFRQIYSNDAYVDNNEMVMLMTDNVMEMMMKMRVSYFPPGFPLEVSALNISVRKQDPRQQTSYSRKQSEIT